MSEHLEHFSINDGAYGFYFQKAFELLDNCSFENLSIIDLIQLYVIKKYEDDYEGLSEVGKQIIDKNRKKFQRIKTELNIYFKKLNDSVFECDISILRKEKHILTHDYLDAINEYFKFVSITFASIKNALDNHILPLYHLLYQRNICRAFEREIKEYILNNSNSIELFVSEYDENFLHGSRHHYSLPKLTEQEISLLIDNYLSNQFANFNTIKCLIYHKNSKDTYFISPFLKTKLKKRFKEMEDELMNNHSVQISDYEIRIDPSQDVPTIYKQEAGHTLLSYSGKWINENTDYPTLLNNLIYVFGLVDLDFRFGCLPRKNGDSMLTDIFESKNKDEYGNMIFNSIDGTLNTSFVAYYQYLERKGIHLETIFEWFSKDYLKSEFNLKGFEISLPVSECNYYLKCKNIFSEIDKFLKSYMVYQKYSRIESDIYEEETLCKYQFLKSLNGNKYFYINKDSEVPTILFYLFNNQSMLQYISTDVKDKTFFKLVESRHPKYDDFQEYNKHKLDYLLDKKVIFLDEVKRIYFVDNEMIFLFKELYFNKFIDARHLEKYTETIQKLIQNKYIIGDDSLFSKYEADYLNYYLNNSQFTNALALRNNYEHPGKLERTVNEMYHDYVNGLKIFALIAIKVNDELCIRFPEIKG